VQFYCENNIFNEIYLGKNFRLFLLKLKEREILLSHLSVFEKQAELNNSFKEEINHNAQWTLIIPREKSTNKPTK